MHGAMLVQLQPNNVVSVHMSGARQQQPTMSVLAPLFEGRVQLHGPELVLLLGPEPL